MTEIISSLIYIVLLISVSVLLFFIVTSVWGTGEPGIIFLLSIISAQLLLSNFAEMRQSKS
ncbi:hypothetical protein SAMN05192559_104130 [Halobacillus karajensis]|nr:hypothetical protein SAMN05192559_104130 [Halobacillus karajensis]